jgi:hypothetical protein
MTAIFDQSPTRPFASLSAEYVLPAPDGADKLRRSFTFFLVAF